MADLDDLFQKKLNEIENGATPESTVQGLPDEAEALKSFTWGTSTGPAQMPKNVDHIDFPARGRKTIPKSKQQSGWVPKMGL